MLAKMPCNSTKSACLDLIKKRAHCLCVVLGQVERVFDEAELALGGSIEITVACVGGGGLVKDKAVKTAGAYTDVADQQTDEYMAILATTQFSTYYTARAAARRMRSRGFGRILIIGSVRHCCILFCREARG